MTPKEKAVIQAAIEAHGIGHLPSKAQDTILRRAVHALIFWCPDCNRGGHACPGDGASIRHGDTDCGRHDDTPQHAGADGSCPDYGSTLDPCPPGCASGTCVAGRPAPEWLPATFRECLAGDRIRLGQEETVVTFSSIGTWHTNGEWSPKHWTHEELVLDLEANPGRRNYPPNTPIEILADELRAGALLLQQSFPGTKPVDI